MKFRIGSAVEAIRREHDPFGSWFPGTIISNDGDSYKIGYKFLKNCKGGPVIEKVHRDDVRPQPLTKARKWMIGDIIEVFNTWCWRVAEVAEMLQENWFVLRLLGGSHQLKEFHESDMRIRQAWHNNKWSIIGKVAWDKQCSSQNYQKFCPKVPAAPQCIKKCSSLRKKCPQARTRKRKPSPSSILVRDIYFAKIRKHEMFIMGKSGMNVKKVRATTGSNGTLSSSITPYRHSEDSDQCSVASCSPVDFADFHGENFRKSVEIDISNGSDAESSYPSGPSRRKLEVDIHDLELHAYESTVQALYASGPLSWEQESLLTNLRLLLNISDEEHLLQLRHLLSSPVL